MVGMPMQRRFCRASLRFAKVIFLLACARFLALPAWASSNPTAQDFLLRDGIPAIADLDGDHVPDTASSIKVGHNEQGYSYHVDLGLSRDANAVPLTALSVEPTGLNIEAIDVDGDHDLDLVITTHLLHRAVGVWLNDGQGRFTRGDPAQYTSPFWRTGYPISPSNAPVLHAISVEKRPFQTGLNSNIGIPGLVPAADISFWPSSVLPVRLIQSSVRLRGPPSISL
jgi:hypothetical protein